jgi:hypothetical protein
MTAPDRIQITHQPRTMTTPDIRALCAELLDWIERASQAHVYGTQDLMARARAALKAELGGPTLDHTNLIGFAFGREPWATWLRKGGCLESAHCELADLMLAVLARWGRPATPPVSEDLAADQAMAANLRALLIKESGLHSPASSTHDLLQRAAAMLVNYGLPARPARPATPPAPVPETPAETLAARPLLERVARLGDVIGQQTVAQVQQLANQAAVWLRENPPGRPVAIEPQGCPTPGACSCVEPTPPAGEAGEAIQPTGRSGLTWEAAIHGLRDVLADQTEDAIQRVWQRSRIVTAMDLMAANTPTSPAPEPREVEEVAQWLHAYALDCRVLGRNDWAEQCTRAATLLQQQEAELAALRVAPGTTFQDAIHLAQGCHDYSGGHSGAEGKAWHGAIDTVVSVLKRAAVGPWDLQTRAVYGVGVEAQAGEVAVPEPVSECPYCGYEGEMVQAPQAGEVES